MQGLQLEVLEVLSCLFEAGRGWHDPRKIQFCLRIPAPAEVRVVRPVPIYCDQDRTCSWDIPFKSPEIPVSGETEEQNCNRVF
jgi:hypothetical protein